MKVQKLADGFDLETQFPGMTDKAKATDFIIAEKSPIALGSVGRSKQTNSFVVTDGGHLDAGAQGSLADGNTHAFFLLIL